MKTVTIAMSGGQDPRLWCSPCNTLRWCLSDSAVTSRQHAAMDFRARRLSHRSAAGVVSRTKTCWVKCAEPIRSESHGRMQGKWQKRAFGVAGVACVQRGPSTLISYGIYIYNLILKYIEYMYAPTLPRWVHPWVFHIKGFAHPLRWRFAL